MKHIKVELESKLADGYEISLGPVNLVMVVTNMGLIGCGALDIAAHDKFNLPAARVSGVATVDDLLEAEINYVNESAKACGIKLGMSGRVALESL